MAETSYRELSLNGLWKNNPAIVQLLGLCPLLAVTGSVVNAIGLAAATTMVLVVMVVRHGGLFWLVGMSDSEKHHVQ